MTYQFTLTDVIPASPETIYDAWLDSRGHTAMTGGKAKMSKRVGGKLSAWDGYISGQNIELVPGKRIVQSWRTTKFTKDDADSQITVTLRPVRAGTKITLKHSNVPDGHTSYEKGGWQTHYFEPMKIYFAKRAKLGDRRKPSSR
jgi:activator of HSP90 ATPase